MTHPGSRRASLGRIQVDYKAEASVQGQTCSQDDNGDQHPIDPFDKANADFEVGQSEKVESQTSHNFVDGSENVDQMEQGAKRRAEQRLQGRA